MNAMSTHHMGTSIATRLLSSKSKMKRDIGPTLAKVSVDRSPGDQFPFLSYAKRHWLRHTSHLEDLPSLPYWHTLLDHPSFGVNQHEFPTRIFIPDIWLQSVDRLLSQAERSKIRNRWRRSMITKQISSLVPPQWASMIWALSSGHILLLKHELTKARGAQRIKSYVKLWSLLRRVSLQAPLVLEIDMDYNMARWLSRMFVNLAIDHPAKDYLLRRIPESDSLHAELLMKAIRNNDVVSICSLIRYDLQHYENLLDMEWYDDDGVYIQRASVPRILKAAFASHPEKELMESMILLDDDWFRNLLPWFCFMNLSYFQWSGGQDPPLSFEKAFEALRQVGVSDQRVGLLKTLLEVARGRLVEIDGLEVSKVPPLED
ncbi:hypothetical protein FPOAC1_009924 [Fusarium poae]|uniref:hypothetical protein n=1 Tax=Fusarium poae TaxID=36050 RepID=UPI001CEA7FCE|nr:hypothetical protein FPOAC1_009924 [Fusarium poae]KAG8670503.1 hypothetical protein FPOAC1_009924 [Fusarium poae]